MDALAAIPVVASIDTQTDPDMELVDTKAQVLTLKRSLQNAQDETEAAKEEACNLSYQIDEFQNQLQESQEAIQKKTEEITLHKNIAEGLKDNIKLLTLKLQAANFEIERVNKESMGLNSHNQELRSKMTELSSRCEALQQEVEYNNSSLTQLRTLSNSNAETITKLSAERDLFEAKLEYFKTVECSCGNLFPISISPPPNNLPYDDVAIGPLDLDFDDSPDDVSCVEGVAVGVKGVRSLRAHGSAQNSVISGEDNPDPDMSRRGVGEEGFGIDDGDYVDHFAAGDLDKHTSSILQHSPVDTAKNRLRPSSPSREDTSLFLPPNEYKGKKNSPSRASAVSSKKVKAKIECSECSRRFNGDGKKLPSDLHSKNLRNASYTPHHRHYDASAYAEVGHPPPPLGYLDNQVACRDKFGHRRGEDYVFCTWKCARKWNQKHTPVILKYRTAQLIDIAEGAYSC